MDIVESLIFSAILSEGTLFMDPTPPVPETKKGEGLGAKHPYLIYLGLTVVLFGFLILMAYLALSNGWLPDRGIHP